MDEPTITINGTTLTTGQAMTLRVALGSFLMSLSGENPLGDDEHGKAMTAAYQARGREIAVLMTEPDRGKT